MKKTAAKKSPAKKAAKKAATKKAATKKSATKKSPAKKATKKTATKKAATKKSPAKKATKKTATKKTAAKKTAAKKAAKSAPAKKTAAKKSPAKKATKKTPADESPARKAATQTPAEQSEPVVLETPNLGARIAPGDRFVVELGDNDAIDFYTFTITRFDDDGLAVAWQMKGVGDHGDIVYTRRALDESTRLTLMSQGSTLYVDESDSDARVDGSMPPFLVSRAFLRDLQAGSATCVFPASNQEHSFAPGERVTRTIKFGGGELTVPVLTASGDSVELEIVDDPTFPLVLRRAEWGDDNVLFHEHQK
jgi:hypothetical protein